jgi:hypothetical protein
MNNQHKHNIDSIDDIATSMILMIFKSKIKQFKLITKFEQE